ncbi:2-hydroxyglutaryl-CoA dehydratase [Candidatus Bathyarchaeota archaeon]|nr:MAG: 2-hydroxyglutaryl-CoA dehydratase [Candidatus Bathyarchaeota archaeon]
MYFAGIDIGSTFTKVVVVDSNGNIASKIEVPTRAEQRKLANKVMVEALNKSNLSLDEIAYIVATGYGRFNVPFADRQVTELTCHARGINSIFPSVKTAIDIGGQDSKGLKVKDGKLVNFVTNDKCAAGTGRFLEVMADLLNLKVEDLGKISLKSTKKVKISSICTVFARYEVMTKISENIPIEDVIAGLHYAIADRIIRMVSRIGIEPDVAVTGGVAKNIGVIRAIEDLLGYKVLVPEDPLITGALGAAIIGKNIVEEALKRGEVIRRGPRRLEEVTFYW